MSKRSTVVRPVTNAGIYISPKTHKEIAGHLMRHRARREDRTLVSEPLFVLEGPPGSGKTTAISEVCKLMQAELTVVPSSSLAGAYAGQATGPLTEAIINASNSAAWQTAVLIDDLDLSEARQDENMAGTVNGALLNGLIMSYADDPYHLTLNEDPEGKTTRSVELAQPPAIFITCNNSNALFEPLIRQGRARRAVLNPTDEELRNIVARMYSVCTAGEINTLLATFPNRSVAFFSALGLAAADNFVESVVGNLPSSPDAFDFSNFARQLSCMQRGARFEHLLVAGRALAAVPESKSHLKSAKS